MKGLNKIALVTAISAASFGANAELKSLDDSAMGELTGQAGITIELETKVNIGEVVYTDTNSGAAGEIGGGSFAMSGISIGGKGGTLLDDLAIDIDLADDGDAIIEVHSQSGLPIDFDIEMASASLNGATDSTLLASNINMEGDLYKLALQVDTATDTLNITAGFTLTDVDVDVDFLSLGIQNLTLTSDNSATVATACGTDVDCNTAGAVAQGTADGIQTAVVNNGLDALGYGNAAVAIMTVGAGTGAVSGKDGLAIGIEYFEADIAMGVTLGGTSIGEIAINDLQVTQTSMLVYGH